jgi:hypothetical protein
LIRVGRAGLAEYSVRQQLPLGVCLDNQRVQGRSQPMEFLHVESWRDVEVAGLPDVDTIGQGSGRAGEDVAHPVPSRMPSSVAISGGVCGAKDREDTAGQTAYECIPPVQTMASALLDSTRAWRVSPTDFATKRAALVP